MPQIFRIGSYIVYIWSDEGLPIEPIHVHVAEGRPSINATKIWITKKHHCLVANNNSKIPPHVLNDIIDLIELRADFICEKWKQHFNGIRYYC